MSKPKVTLRLRKSHIEGEGYIAYLVVASEKIFIDVPLPDIMAADDLHTKLAKAFSLCGINLLEDLE
jgi:hypothetical protein